MAVVDDAGARCEGCDDEEEGPAPCCRCAAGRDEGKNHGSLALAPVS